MMTRLSIIIPVYNEQQTVAEVVKRVSGVKIHGVTKEVVIVNDGSTDLTRSILADVGRHGTGIKVFNSVINLGKGAAVRIGIAKSTGNIIIIQDADLELNPNEYGKILQPILSSQAQVVYGSRFRSQRSTIPAKTIWANKILTTLTNLLFNTDLTDMETAYKAFTRETLSGIRLRSLEFDFEPEITARIAQKGIKIAEVPISYRPRSVKEGKRIGLRDAFEVVYTLLRCRFF